MSAQNTAKQAVARAALEFVEPGKVLGIGTGTTVNFLIDELREHRVAIAGAVSSSSVSTKSEFQIIERSETLRSLTSP